MCIDRELIADAVHLFFGMNTCFPIDFYVFKYCTQVEHILHHPIKHHHSFVIHIRCEMFDDIFWRFFFHYLFWFDFRGEIFRWSELKFFFAVFCLFSSTSIRFIIFQWMNKLEIFNWISVCLSVHSTDLFKRFII